MSIQINRFEVISLDRVDKNVLAIKDHKTDETIITIKVSNYEDNKQIGEGIIELLEELIQNKDINYE